MKTTFRIDDTVMAQLKREANRQGRTMSDLVETALRTLFREQRRPSTLDSLPGFHGAGPWSTWRIAARCRLFTWNLANWAGRPRACPTMTSAHNSTRPKANGAGEDGR